MKYSFDTSGFLNPWKHFYRPNRFPKLWKDIDALIQSQEIVATEMVYQELKAKNDDLTKWIAARKERLLIKIDEEQMRIVGEIENEFPDLVPIKSTTDRADPYVVALARYKRLVVVTDEKRPRKGRVKIPQVCEHYGIDCIDFQRFLDEIGYQDS